MEPAENRSDSPPPVCKAVDEESEETYEIVPKKKSQRIKQKMLEKEVIVDSTVNGNDLVRNGIEEMKEGNSQSEFGESNGFENGHNEIANDCTLEKSTEVPTENGTSAEISNGNDITESNLNLDESTTGSDGTTPVIVDDDIEELDVKESPHEVKGETECSANNVTAPPENSHLSEQENDSQLEENEAEENGVCGSSINGQESKEYSNVEVSGIPVNGSDVESFYETVESVKEDQESPGTTTHADNSFTHKISSFLGKWQTSSPLLKEGQTEDGNVSSSRKSLNAETVEKGGKPAVLHPYLSKVTGRRGIKTRSNTNGVETETPKNKGPVLSDSFRVKTDPPRLSQADTGLESMLRKYKGKRCLNVNDDDDDENGYENGEDLYPTSTKRRKLDEKASGSGFLGNVLWSPFKKKPDEKAVTQSKLTRFLSPFWFWKKTVTDHERK